MQNGILFDVYEDMCMTTQMVKDVCDFYNTLDIDKFKVREDCEKIKSMGDQIKKFIETEQVEKAMRWLGFVQGILYKEQIFTIDEMRAHNRGDLGEMNV